MTILWYEDGVVKVSNAVQIILATATLSLAYRQAARWKRRGDTLMALPGRTYDNAWLCDLSYLLQQPRVPGRPNNRDLWSYTVNLCLEFADKGVVRLIGFSPYRLPFMSNSFIFLLDMELVKACLQHPLCQKGSTYEVSKPLIADSVLIAHDGPSWKRQRKLAARAFSNQVMERVTEKTASLFHLVVYPNYLNPSADDPDGDLTVDVVDLMTRFALELLGEVAFSKSLGSLTEQRQQSNTNGGEEKTLYLVFEEIMLALSLHNRSGGLYKFVTLRSDFKPNLQRLNRTIKLLIEERIQGVTGSTEALQQHDLMGMLLQRDEDGEFILSRAEILGNTKTFLFAGHDTTSTTLVMVLYELSHHPGYVKRLREEVDPLFEKNGTRSSPTYTQLRGLELLDKIIRETLRLYAPGNFGRAPLEDIVIETSKHRIEVPKGVELVVSPYILHRLTWDDAEVWNPDRTHDGTSTYIPFSYGARNCVGRELGLAEIRAVVAHIVHDYDMIPLDEEVKLFTRLTLNPNQCHLKFRHRK